ncbi:LOW QUALITY PROTEIN: WD repeat-containing and planar cell polarity effector protein fritz homolog [Amphiura filiformis]|uniref:LOW QUALITY PROTEIN: WD repeat-containing and planar cell polarity effector protein fritz homolog n=1 Tax=Amphiura filiformis TaxID=82378 RepID=UPI003B21C8EE
MASCMIELHLWTLKNSVIVKDNDVGCHAYHDKGDSVVTGYLEQKQLYTEGRDLVWTPKNRRPDKLRDLIKEVEDVLMIYDVVYSRWRSRRYLQVVLSNCVIVSFVICAHSGDVEKIFIDRSLQGKLCSDVISTAILTDTFLVCTFPDKPKLGLIYFNKRPSSGSGQDGKKIDKLSNFDPKVSHIDLPGHKSRRLTRKLSVNVNHEWVLVWWSSAGEEAWPWTPMTSDRDRANVIVYAVNGGKLEELSFVSTEYQPIDVSFSFCQPRHIHTLENVTLSSEEYKIDTCIYECSKNRIQRATVTTIPLTAPVVCHGRNNTEDKLLIGCQDGKLVSYDQIKRTTRFIQTDSIPKHIAWHPAGCLLFVASVKSEIQCFDMALNQINLVLVGEEAKPSPVLHLAAYFRSASSSNLLRLIWARPSTPTDVLADAIDSLFMNFENGPLGILTLHLGILSRGQLGSQELMQQYLKHQQISEAVSLLTCMNWNTESSSCFTCLSFVMNHLLRLPLTPEREAALETSLGSFYAPVRPLSEVIVVDYRDPISRLARRFFHQLLRYQRFEKAFLLAVDLHSRDLFMDIHYLALDKGERALAAVAKQKADEIEQEMPSASDTDNVDSYTESSGEEDDYSSDSYYSEEDERDQRRADVTPTRHRVQEGPERAAGGHNSSGQGAKGKSALKPRPLPQASRSTRQVDKEPWYQAEDEIDQAFALGADIEELHLDDSRGLAGIPGDVYIQVLSDNPFGWDQTDSSQQNRQRQQPPREQNEPGPSAQHPQEPGERQGENRRGTTKTVKVIHFGMV